MAQQFTDIPASRTLQQSLAELLNNDKTALSSSSGTAFPTTNLQIGMLCFRTDQNKLYILKDATPTWSLIWDFAFASFGQGANIGSAVDLNTMTTTGWYHQNLDAQAASGSNYPVAFAGLLKVHGAGAMTYQQYQPYNSGDPGGGSQLYFRSCYNGTWGAWRRVITLTNDGAGSGLDADMLDGMHASSFAPLASPALTGTPTAPTATAGTNTTQVATTAFVQTGLTNTAKTNTAQNFTAPQRSALLADNDGSFDLSAKQNFKCTPTAGITLTFANQADGLSGSVIFINGGDYAIAAHVNTKLTASDLAKLSASGTYRIDYLSDGTNAYCSVVGSY